MGFLNLCLPDGRALQVSDSVVTYKRLVDVIVLSTRRSGGVDGPFVVQYNDEDGDWVSVVEDADVVEMFRAARASRAATSPLPVGAHSHTLC